MVTVAQMAVISIMAGLVAGGFVWFGWDLAANLHAVWQRKKANRTPKTGQSDTGEGDGLPPGRLPM